MNGEHKLVLKLSRSDPFVGYRDYHGDDSAHVGGACAGDIGEGDRGDSAVRVTKLWRRNLNDRIRIMLELRRELGDRLSES